MADDLHTKVTKACAAIFEIEDELRRLNQDELRRRIYGLRIDLSAAMWRCSFPEPAKVEPSSRKEGEP